MTKPLIQKWATLLTNEAVKSVIPENIPPMKWNAGLLSRMVYNSRLHDMDRAAAFQSSIAQSQLKNVQAKCQMIEEMVTLSQRLQSKIEELDHKRSMMKNEREKAELQNLLLRLECEQARIETQLKAKEAKEILNESSEDRR